LQADTAQTPHAVHVLSRHLCAVKANKVEEDIQGATKVGKHVKWHVLDIKFGKQAKKNLNLQEAALGLKEKAQGVSFEAMLTTQIGLELFGRFEDEKERHIQKTQKELPL